MNESIEGYTTVAHETRAEITIKKSVFIACVAPAATKTDALSYLGGLRTEYWDAVHHCYAYRIGPQGMEYRMSDDGEPSGTAGKPLLFALQRSALSDVALVVVRYFGGIKLGVGPLARAYSEAAQAALEKCERVAVVPMAALSIFCTYDDVSRITSLLQEVNATFEPHYSDAVTFVAMIPASLMTFVEQEIVTRTNARAGFSKNFSQ
ncbi:MAG: YigZ family protein [bacterium]|nr:YigZ family protein [bacterium]